MSPRQPTLAFEAVFVPVRLPPEMPLPPSRYAILRTGRVTREVTFPFGAFPNPATPDVRRVLTVTVRETQGREPSVRLVDKRTGSEVAVEDLHELDQAALGRAVANRLRAVEEAS